MYNLCLFCADCEIIVITVVQLLNICEKPSSHTTKQTLVCVFSSPEPLGSQGELIVQP